MACFWLFPAMHSGLFNFRLFGITFWTQVESKKEELTVEDMPPTTYLNSPLLDGDELAMVPMTILLQAKKIKTKQIDLFQGFFTKFHQNTLAMHHARVERSSGERLYRNKPSFQETKNSFSCIILRNRRRRFLGNV